MASFSPRAGCPLCGIVSTAQHAPRNSVRSPSHPAGSKQPEVLWRDDNFTAYREKANPVSSSGHVIISFNLHVPSIYSLSSSDLPLLVNIRNIARRLLPSHAATSMPAVTSSPSNLISSLDEGLGHPKLHVGFIVSPFRDPKIPVTDHLHAHAYLAPLDMAGWWRSLAYSSLAWYAIDDLIAEIRETTSNNRVKSGYEHRMAPIDSVEDAGARSGTADGVELTEPSLSTAVDLEAGLGPLTPTRSHSPASRPTTPLRQVLPQLVETGESSKPYLTAE